MGLLFPKGKLEHSTKEGKWRKLRKKMGGSREKRGGWQLSLSLGLIFLCGQIVSGQVVEVKMFPAHSPRIRHWSEGLDEWKAGIEITGNGKNVCGTEIKGVGGGRYWKDRDVEPDRWEAKDYEKSNKEWEEKKNGEGTKQKPAISQWGDRRHNLWQCEEGVVEKLETNTKSKKWGWQKGRW